MSGSANESQRTPQFHYVIFHIIYLYMFALQISLKHLVMKTVSEAGKEKTLLTQYSLYVLFCIKIHEMNTNKHVARHSSVCFSSQAVPSNILTV